MLFLLGNPRSGTSLFRLMLTSHSEIHVPPECGFIVWWLKKYSEWSQPVSPKFLSAFLDDLFKSRKFEFWQLNRDILEQTILSRTPKNYAALCREVYLLHAKQAGKIPLYLGDKNNFHVNHVAELAQLYPNSRFIHIVRDGRDVATSYQAMRDIKSDSVYRPNLPSDLREIATEWRSNILSVKKAFDNLPVNRWHEIRYEDLVMETSLCLKSVCEFLELDFEQGMQNYYENSAVNVLEPEEFFPWKERTTKTIDKTAIGKFKLWPEENTLLFESVCADVLALYDYKIHSIEKE